MASVGTDSQLRSGQPAPAGIIRRTRQACTNCRRKKTRCSGERPTCSHCRRKNRVCLYKPYPETGSDNQQASLPSSLLNHSDVLQRISTLESKLAELSGRAREERIGSSSPEDITSRTVPESGRAGSHGSSDPSVQLSGEEPTVDDLHTLSYKTLPPQPVLRSLVDTYFLYSHNQPYSYFQEASFRRKLDSGLLPRCLVFAVLASALRFSAHEYYSGRAHEAAEAYARESWLSVLQDHLTVENSPNLHVVQTTNLLAVIDFTAGRISSGWLKIGLAVRISQDLHLMKEPRECLSYTEQEEWRRVFWSVYLLDKLVSCGKARPPAIADEDCHVQVPCDEQTLRSGGWKKTPTLNQLLNGNTDVCEMPSNFALTVLMASILGRCNRYVLHERDVDEMPPWDPKSEFASINSTLLLVESYARVGGKSIADIVNENLTPEGDVDQQLVGHFIFARTVFHLCHCLLNHPFLLRMRLKRLGSKTPPASFSSRAFQTSCDHARKLVNLLDDIAKSGYLAGASFYAYAVTIAGGVLSLNFHHERARGGAVSSDLLNVYQQSVDALERVAGLWGHASNMVLHLRDFHSRSHKFTSLLDPYYIANDLGSDVEEALWSMIDYGTLCSSSRPVYGSSLPDTPSPSSFGLDSGLMPGSSDGYMPSNNDIFTGMLPGLRPNEVDFLLNIASGGA
ncbi:hypothetical protein VTN00DRAFT_3212 [Thermoascus crustaceus]|uniref:uncharacterized protein n=1 Tax=Thermoascus crustaceus TaxID=5088 RepID=UPI003743D67A